MMSWGSQALVLEPESLGKEIRAEAMELLGRYGKKMKEMPVRV